MLGLVHMLPGCFRLTAIDKTDEAVYLKCTYPYQSASEIMLMVSTLRFILLAYMFTCYIT